MARLSLLLFLLDTSRVASLSAGAAAASTRGPLLSAPTPPPPRARMDHAPRAIRTVARETSHAIVVGKSRFLATAARVATAEEANERARRLADPRARHNCFAWRLAGGATRTNGDGEPGGTAGPPILAAIEAAGLHDVLVLVARYRLGEGGKLGTGGLVRAYGGAARACLEQAEAVVVEARVAAVARFFAADTGAVFGLIEPFSPDVTVLPTEPPETLAKFDVDPADFPRLAEDICSATSGRVKCFLLEDDEPEM
ncbi:hypothetical protein AB1Y20_017586 [Prymnesium parvum]|uniref:Impact N-terminal domain-containing protein n=1 Tax=Prymnesium parvum TaxID=97485 RepID=A0AB34JLP0_PRYPA